MNSVHRYFGNTHKPNIKDIWNMIMYVRNMTMYDYEYG